MIVKSFVIRALAGMHLVPVVILEWLLNIAGRSMSKNGDSLSGLALKLRIWLRDKIINLNKKFEGKP